ncbi:MAG: hypothetical protein AAF965_00150 [Pseudomonadota bacterium]
MRWLLTALIAVACLEGALRLGAGLGQPPLVTLSPETEYQLVPSKTYRRFGNDIEINAFGLRGPDMAATAEPEERRVLLIGDSVIYGNHFLDQTEIIATRLTEHLRAATGLDNCQPSALAFAASSWGPVNQAAFLAETGPLDAALALLVVSSHDLYDTPRRRGHVIPYRLTPPIGAIGDAVESLVERVRRQFVPAPAIQTRAERRAASLVVLDQLAGQLAAENVPLVLVYHPTVPERQTGLAPEEKVFSNWAASKEVPYVALNVANSPDMYRDHIHPSATVADEIAQALARIATPKLRPCDTPG